MRDAIRSCHRGAGRGVGGGGGGGGGWEDERRRGRGAGGRSACVRAAMGVLRGGERLRWREGERSTFLVRCRGGVAVAPGSAPLAACDASPCRDAFDPPCDACFPPCSSEHTSAPGRMPVVRAGGAAEKKWGALYPTRAGRRRSIGLGDTGRRRSIGLGDTKFLELLVSDS